MKILPILLALTGCALLDEAQREALDQWLAKENARHEALQGATDPEIKSR